LPEHAHKDKTMQIEPFRIERYFARYEFTTRYLLSSSDSEPFSMRDLLGCASETRRQQWEDLVLGYTESRGHPELLTAIARLYSGVNAEQVIEVVPEEGIFLAMNALLRSGDHIVATAPAYQSLHEIARANGCTVAEWFPKRDAGWHFDVSELSSLIRPETRMLIVNFPHNPTGALPSREEFNAIVGLARQHNLILFSDEMYRYFEYNPDDRLPSAVELYENAVSLCGLSKSFGLPGLRVGWLVTRSAEYMTRIGNLKDYTTICGSAPSELLAIIALENLDALSARNLAITRHNLTVLDAFFSRHTNLLWWQRPIAGTITLAEIHADIDMDQFAEDSATRAGVMILPSSTYNYPGNYFRIGFGRRNLPEALSAFEKHLLGAVAQ
jgi:aspartate/methionine/tyrosine aminotransferase